MHLFIAIVELMYTSSKTRYGDKGVRTVKT